MVKMVSSGACSRTNFCSPKPSWVECHSSSAKLPLSDSFCAPHPWAFFLQVSHSCSARILLVLLCHCGCQVTMSVWY